jgi:hypothetical protein
MYCHRIIGLTFLTRERSVAVTPFERALLAIDEFSAYDNNISAKQLSGHFKRGRMIGFVKG